MTDQRVRTSSRNRLILFVVLVLGCSLATGPLAVATPGGASGATDGSTSLDGSIADLDDTTDDLEDGVDDTTDDLEDGVDDTTDDTTDETEDTIDDTTDELEDGVDDTTDDLEDGVNETIDVVEDTVDVVGDTIDDTTDALENTLSSTSDLLATDTADEDEEVAASEESANDANDSPSVGPSDVADAVMLGLLGLAALSSAGAGGVGTITSTSYAARSRLGRLVKTFRSVPWELSPLSILRYSRYDDSDPLEHDQRRTIFESIESEPGLYLSAIVDRTDTSLSTVRHHARILEEEGLLSTAKIHGKRRYFPADSDDVELCAALSEPSKRRVLEVLVAGDAHNGQVADELDIDPSTASHHLSTLEEAGLVERERDGRTIVNRLAPAAATLAEGSTDGAEATASTPSDD